MAKFQFRYFHGIDGHEQKELDHEDYILDLDDCNTVTEAIRFDNTVRRCNPLVMEDIYIQQPDKFVGYNDLNDSGEFEKLTVDLIKEE